MYRSLDKSVKSSPDGKKLSIEDDERNYSIPTPPSFLHNRYDRVNNIHAPKAVTKKRIRGKGSKPLPIMNTLISKRPKLEKEKVDDGKDFFESAPSSSSAVNSSPIKDITSFLNAFDEREKGNNNDSQNAESDDDFASNLIEVSKFSSSPLKRRASDLDRLDEIINQSDSQSKDSSQIHQGPGSSSSAEKSSQDIAKNLSGARVDLAEMVAKGDFLSEISKKRSLSKEEIVTKFGSSNKYPKPITSKRLLHQRISKLLPIIPSILRGKVDTCYIYPIARTMASKSPHETMTQKEKFEINWQLFFGGYYGFQRQSFISSIILNKYSDELQQAINKNNKVVTYWTIHGFSTFILANEIIVRLIMEDLECDFEHAESVLKESAEYGVDVTDAIDLIDDLGAEDPLKEEAKRFMKGLEGASQEVQKRVQQKPSDKKNIKHDDILDKLMNSESESDDSESGNSS